MNPRGWSVSESLGPETKSVIFLRSQVQISLGANNLYVGTVYTEFCSGFKWNLSKWTVGLVDPMVGYRAFKNTSDMIDFSVFSTMF